MVFLLTKKPTYFYDATAVRVYEGNGWHKGTFMHPYQQTTKPGLGQQPRQEQPGRNVWNYWVLGPEPTANGHYASFPTALAERCIRAGCPQGGIVLDPFAGSATTGLAARAMGRHAICLDLSWPYLHTIARQRLGFTALAAWEGRDHPREPRGFGDLPLFLEDSHD
jgi:site-specific DNA-methyltransferase (cytosine-N4-specific)